MKKISKKEKSMITALIIFITLIVLSIFQGLDSGYNTFNGKCLDCHIECELQAVDKIFREYYQCPNCYRVFEKR